MNIGGTNAEARLTELSKAIERLERVIDAIRTEMDFSHKISNEEEDEPDHALKMAIAWFGVKLRDDERVTLLVNTAGEFSDEDVGSLSLLNQPKFHEIYSDSIGSGWSLMKFKSLMLNAFIPDDQADKYITLFERLWVEWMKSEECQWVELPSEADEDWDSNEYSTRRFVLGVVKCYIYSIETDTDIMDNMKKLQSRFNYLNDDFLASGFGFKSAFLKYLRLCGGDKCFREVKDAFGLWIKNYKPLADRTDHYDDEEEDIEDSIDDVVPAEDSLMKDLKRQMAVLITAFLKLLSRVLMDQAGNEATLDSISISKMELIRSSTQDNFNEIYKFAMTQVRCSVSDLSVEFYRVSMSQFGSNSIALKPGFESLWDSWMTHIRKNGY